MFVWLRVCEMEGGCRLFFCVGGGWGARGIGNMGGHIETMSKADVRGSVSIDRRRRSSSKE